MLEGMTVFLFKNNYSTYSTLNLRIMQKLILCLATCVFFLSSQAQYRIVQQNGATVKVSVNDISSPAMYSFEGELNIPLKQLRTKSDQAYFGRLWNVVGNCRWCLSRG